MAPRTRTERLLLDYVQQFANPPSDNKIAECWQRCDDHGHDLIGPVLQYKADNFNLGRWIVLVRARRFSLERLSHPTFTV